MAEIESGKISVNRVQPGDSTSAARTESGEYAVPAAVRTSFHVHDQRERVAGYVRREVLRNALGETYAFDVLPVTVPTGTGGIDVGYMLALSTPSPMIGTGQHVTVTSKPFEYMMSEETVQEIVRQMIAALRKAVADMLRIEEVPPIGHPER